MAGFAADNAEDTLGNHIEQILAVLRPKTEFLRSQAKAGAAPTTEQITTFFQRCGAEIGPHVRRLDTKIKRRMQNCFHQCGYDVAHARLIRAVPVPTMLASFETMVSGLGSLLRGPVPPPSEEEIKDIRFAAQRMWNLDYNRVGHGHGLTIDLQRGKSYHDRRDVAPDPLFSYVDPSVLRRPTVAAFISLLDNYDHLTGHEEHHGRLERREEDNFLTLSMQTPVMRFCHEYLARRGKAPRDAEGFKRLLYRLWFELYSRTRGVRGDSCGFEHVFVGEVRDGAVLGFHNWIQFYVEERKGAVDYGGYIRPRERTRTVSEEEALITINFTWLDTVKPGGSMLVGTSPEFELALHTMCFMDNDEDHTEVFLGDYTMDITTHIYRGRGGKKYIGTSYPNAAKLTEHGAANKIKAALRGRLVKKHGALEYHRRREEAHKTHHAARTIQRRARGARDRRRYQQRKAE